MNQTLQTLLPILHYLSGAGAGVVASLLFAALRRRWPLPDVPIESSLDLLALRALWSRRGSRMSVLLLSSLIGGAAGVILAVLQGQDAVPIVDALTAAVISQVWHAATDLTSELPEAES